MSTVLIDTHDLAEAEEVFSATYAKQRLSVPRDAPSPHIKVARSRLGPLAADEITFSSHLETHLQPLKNIVLCRIRSGVLEQRFPDGRIEVARADDVTAAGGRADLPFSVEITRTHYDALSVDRALLNCVAAGPPSLGESAPVHLTSESPISSAANAHMASVIDHITRNVLTNPHATASPMIVDSVASYLASAMLEAFPNTALLDPTIEDRHDSTPALLRKAIAFIDDNADREISLVAIAESIHVSPRALQYMFRKHLDTTPTEYLRRVRLHQAHLALVAGDRMKTTVGRVAADWGFSHLGRFAIYYRKHYGVSPHQTLRR